MLTSIAKDHLAQIKLWYLVQHSISSFYKLQQYFGSAAEAVQAKNLLKWKSLKLHNNHVQRAESFYSAPQQQQFEQCIQKIKTHSDFILTATFVCCPRIHCGIF